MPTNQPNFLFILVDDMGPWALGAAGNDEIQTPNLDRLAKRGVRFENFFCASPVCSPARASILTGLMPSQHGVLDWIASGNVDKERMDREGVQNPYGGYGLERKPIRYIAGEQTYTAQLAEAGYELALSGKWHLGDSMTPQAGFLDRWYTIGKGGAQYYYPDIIEEGEIKVVNEYVTTLFTDKALDYLDEMYEKPFYLGVHYTAPHSPWEAENHPAEMLELYRDCDFHNNPDVPDHEGLQVPPVYGTDARRENLIGYYAAVTAMDRDVGRLLDRLEELGIDDKTYVFFMSDNGMCMGHHGVWGKGNGTFPQNMYEESVKVPCIISGPGIAEDYVATSLYSQIDLYPTILELAGVAPSGNELARPGKSFVSALSGNENSENHAYICDEYGTVRMLRTKTDKYVHRSPWGPHEFYDLQTDPRESNNLFGDPDYADLILERRHELEDWFANYSDPSFDGTRQPVTGFGQLDRVDSKSRRLDKFGQEQRIAPAREIKAE